MVFATDNVGDFHIPVIDNHTEVIGWGTIGTADNQIIQLLVAELDRTTDLIVKNNRTFLRVSKTYDTRLIISVMLMTCLLYTSSLPIAHYGQMEMTDILSGAIVAAITIAAGMVAVWCLPRLHAMMHQMKNPVFVLGIGGFILGILGVIGGPVSLFKGLDEMQQMVANQARCV